MAILKRINLIFIFLLFNCKNITYTKDESSFWGIYLSDWNSVSCPKKILYEQYVKESNFSKLIKSDFDFNISDCEDIYKTNNQRVLNPINLYTGKINYDIKLVIDDSLEFKITSIKNKIDTVFYGGRPGDYTIMNNISSFTVNGQKVDNTQSPLNIRIPTKLGKIIKK